jgi:hypothetical protein
MAFATSYVYFIFIVVGMPSVHSPRVYGISLLNFIFIKKRKKGGLNLYLEPRAQRDGPSIRVPTASDMGDIGRNRI